MSKAKRTTRKQTIPQVNFENIRFKLVDRKQNLFGLLANSIPLGVLEETQRSGLQRSPC